MFVLAILLLFVASQVYWAWRVRSFLRKRIESEFLRVFLGLSALALYAGLFVYSLPGDPVPTRATLPQMLFAGPFQVWIPCSLISFLIAMTLLLAKKLAPPVSPQRRRFLKQTGTAVVAAPFVGGAYGLLYGRLNLETVEKKIRLARLPGAFHGFRIAQLSDIHISPFMSEDEIRKFVRIANSLRAEMIVLTGDFVTWHAAAQQAVVNALSGLHAPFGVYGCLGNHDAWTGAEDSITALFQQTGVRILRRENAAVALHGDSFSLIGVDYETLRPVPGQHNQHLVTRYLDGVESLVAPDRVNILLSHNPDAFDRAAEMGIDLTLSGHTHGGQVALEFISPELTPARLVTPYIAGSFDKPGGQLYVNRGIGTIGIPVRIGAPPEITVFELARG